MEVVWSGAMERAAIERARVYPQQTLRRSVKDAVYDHLGRGDATMPELAAALGIDQHAVNGALYQLKKNGAVVATARTVRTRNNRTACYYHRV